VHLFWSTFKESPATANEQCVSSKDGAVVAVFEIEADAVLCMAWGVERFDVDGTDLKGAVVAGCLGDFVAVATANYRQAECFDLWKWLADEFSLLVYSCTYRIHVTSSMVSMTVQYVSIARSPSAVALLVSVDYLGQLKTPRRSLLPQDR
jgi:hypothetical protein